MRTATDVRPALLFGGTFVICGGILTLGKGLVQVGRDQTDKKMILVLLTSPPHYMSTLDETFGLGGFGVFFEFNCSMCSV